MKLNIGMSVVFIDEDRQEREALVTCIHGDPEGALWEQAVNGGQKVKGSEGTAWPCVNLLTLSKNEACQDQYGRQAERHSSVVHVSTSTAQGFCYRFPGEAVDRSQRQPSIS